MEVIKHNIKSKKPYCILGVVNNEAGREIEKEMLRWLLKSYRVIEIIHDGSQYEYPALSFMQEHCIETMQPCLYIHTRGAFHRWNTTKPTHRMWEYEFGKCSKKYFSAVDTIEATVACPFSGVENHTWYNGFVANAKAMDVIGELLQPTDRMYYEHIFKDKDVQVIGMLINSKKDNGLKDARRYLLEHYK